MAGNERKPNDDTGIAPIRRQTAWLLIMLFMFYAWFWMAGSAPPPTEIPYTEFKTEVRNDRVASVLLEGHRVSGMLRHGSIEGPAGQQRFTSHLPPVDDPELIPLLEEMGVTVTARSEEGAWWARALLGMLPWLFLLGLIWYSTRRMQDRLTRGAGGVFDFGKSRAKRFRKDVGSIGFDDVAGLENAKRDLKEIVAFLTEPERYRKLGAKVPRGILLMGPPGTGKTLLAKAVAGEAGVPFFSISGSEFIEVFVGVGASRVRDMFESAMKEAPAIIFIDEIDSVGRARGTGLGGGHDEREQTLNQILAEMDGFSPEHSVVVLAATNRPDVLDSALLRPGRFDRKITLELPRKAARRKILDVHARHIPLAGDVDLDVLAARTAGFSGADLENLLNEAALLAGRHNREQVDAMILDQARDKVVLGAVSESLLSEEERQRVAVHEAGHALLACLLPHTDPVAKVTIIPRGRALGVTEQLPEEERYNLKESYLRDRITVMLGGRVAESLLLDEVSSGAEDDLKQATRLARHMVSHWGMSGKLGPVAFHRGEEHIFLGREMAQQRDFSEHTARLIDEEVRALVSGLEKKARGLLDGNRERLRRLADALLEHETLEADEIRELLERDCTQQAVHATECTGAHDDQAVSDHRPG